MRPSWYHRDPADFRDDPRFRRLTLEQQGAYWHLLDSIHLSDDGALPWSDDDVPVMASLPVAAVLSVLASGLLYRDEDGMLRSQLIDASREEYESRCKVKRENALQGWARRKKAATAMRPHSDRNAESSFRNAEERNGSEVCGSNQSPQPPVGDADDFPPAEPSTKPHRKRTQPKGEAIAIPASLDTTAFREAWEGWIEHRREKRKPATNRAMKQQLKNLEAMGHDRAVAAIAYSVGNGWDGIFEQSSGGGRPKPDGSDRLGRVEAPPGKYDKYERAWAKLQADHAASLAKGNGAAPENGQDDRRD